MIELRNNRGSILLGLNPNGKKRYAIDFSISAVQMRELGEQWQDIDPSVEAADTGGFSIKTGQTPYLARIGDDSHRRTYPDRTNLNVWIEFKKPFANMPAPTRLNRWFYWDFPNALMGIRFDSTAIKFSFRLKNSNAPTSLTIPFTSQGLTRQGRLLYADGKVVAILRRPTAIDANGVERDCGVSFGTGQVTISLDTTGLVFPIDIDPTLDVQVGASTDDARRRLSTAYWADALTTIAFDVGSAGTNNEKYGSGGRFTNVTIPQGSTIDLAYLTIRCRSATSGTTVNSYISAEDVDNPATFADDATAFDNRYAARTTAQVAWDNIAAWTLDVDYNSPEIKTVIQEIVDRAGWASGNAIVIFWEDFAGRSTSGAGRMRLGYSYDGNSTYPPRLHIEYTEVGGQPYISRVQGVQGMRTYGGF